MSPIEMQKLKQSMFDLIWAHVALYGEFGWAAVKQNYADGDITDFIDGHVIAGGTLANCLQKFAENYALPDTIVRPDQWVIVTSEVELFTIHTFDTEEEASKMFFTLTGVKPEDADTDPVFSGESKHAMAHDVRDVWLHQPFAHRARGWVDYAAYLLHDKADWNAILHTQMKGAIVKYEGDLYAVPIQGQRPYTEDDLDCLRSLSMSTWSEEGKCWDAMTPEQSMQPLINPTFVALRH